MQLDYTHSPFYKSLDKEVITPLIEDNDNFRTSLLDKFDDDPGSSVQYKLNRINREEEILYLIQDYCRNMYIGRENLLYFL
jgi:hypothetical protein